MQTVLIVIGVIVVFALFTYAYKEYQDAQLRSYAQSIYGQKPDMSFDDESFKALKHLSTLNKGDTVDAMTWNDLSMDDIYLALNNCLSSVGDEVLYDHLKSQNDFNQEHFDHLVDLLGSDSDLRKKVQYTLGTLGRDSKNSLSVVLDGINEGNIRMIPYAKVRLAFAILPLFIIPLNVAMGIMLFVMMFTLNMATYLSMNKILQARIRGINYFVSVLKASRKMDGSLLSHPEALDDFKHIKTGMSVMTFSVEQDAGIRGILYLVNAYLCLYALSYNKIVGTISHKKDAALHVVKDLGLIDAALSTASYIEYKKTTCKPVFSDTEAPSFEGISHPLIEDAVENTLSLSKNVLTTGSNASGKSTFVKAIAVNAIFAQRLGFACASRFEMRKAYIASSMAIKDDIASGDSYFVAELKSIKRLLAIVDHYPYAMIFIDEILKGTNTIERIAASSSILQHLATKPCFIVAATHDIELVSILDELFVNIHFRETVEDEGISFDYKVHQGPSLTKNALKLLSYYDYDQEIITKATTMAEYFESNKKWLAV